MWWQVGVGLVSAGTGVGAVIVSKLFVRQMLACISSS